MVKKTYASLFTGGGLADIGAQQSGYEVVWGIDNDPQVQEWGDYNVGHSDTYHLADVTEFDFDKVPRVDHLHLSPPCQDFSVARGRQLETKNPNEALAQACIRAISAVNPSTITLENVEAYKKSPAFQSIVDHLYGRGYWVDYQVLNAADFGVPQTRRRLILRAIKNQFLPPLPQPVAWVGWYEAIEDLIPTLPESDFAQWQIENICMDEIYPFLVHPSDQRTMPIRAGDGPSFTLTANASGNSIKAALLSTHENEWGTGARLGDEPSQTCTQNDVGRKRAIVLVAGIGPSSSVRYRESNQPSFTVTATGKEVTRLWSQNSRVVKLNARAIARLQTVPDSYQLPEQNYLSSRILGNGVPCLMMRRILESLDV